MPWRRRRGSVTPVSTTVTPPLLPPLMLLLGGAAATVTAAASFETAARAAAAASSAGASAERPWLCSGEVTLTLTWTLSASTGAPGSSVRDEDEEQEAVTEEARDIVDDDNDDDDDISPPLTIARPLCVRVGSNDVAGFLVSALGTRVLKKIAACREAAGPSDYANIVYSNGTAPVTPRYLRVLPLLAVRGLPS